MANSKYSVSWDDYRKSICNGLSGLQQRGEFVDMTLAADGHRVKAHKMVLSLVSPYIKDLIDSTACNHPVLFLSKVSYQTLQSILEYAYTGEVVVANERIQEFLLVCKELRVRGLEGGGTKDVESAQQATCTDMDVQQFNTNTDIQQVNKYAHYQQVNSNMDVQQDDSKADMDIPEPTVHSAESPSFDNDNDSDIARSYDEEDNDELSSTKKPVLKPTSDSYAPDPGLKFTISNMGSAQVVLNRFLYNHRHTRKNGGTLWRCVNYTKPAKLKQRCQAFVVLKDNHVLQRACSHNHPFHDAQILRKLRVRNMFTSMTETQKIIAKKNMQKNIEKKTQKNIEKKTQKNIENIEAINQGPGQKSIRRPQSETEPAI